MERLFYFATAVAVLLGGRFSLAEDKYTFGPVPSASPFAEKVDSSATPPAAVDSKKIAAPAPSNSVQLNTAVPAAEPPKPIVIVGAGGGLDGKVAAVDERGHFVVLNFPLGQMPPVNSTLYVYRHGVKVGVLSVTGPQRDDNTVADIVSGALQIGDAARNR